MNPLVKTQLDKIRGVDLPPYDDNTLVINIDKMSSTMNELRQDECYLISVEDYILNPPDGFTLHTNWNNNKIPKHKVMKVDVSKVMGKMIKVNAIGYDLKSNRDIPESWEGWLPEKSIKVIERL